MNEPTPGRGERTHEQRERMQRKYNRARFERLFGADALLAILSSPIPPTQVTRKSN